MVISSVLAFWWLLSKNDNQDRQYFNLEIQVTTTAELPASHMTNSVDRSICGVNISTQALRKSSQGHLLDVVGILQPTQIQPPSALDQQREAPLLRISKCHPTSLIGVAKPNEKIKLVSDDPILYQLRSQSSLNGRKIALLPPNLMAGSVLYEKSEIVKLQDDIHPWIRFFVVIDERPAATTNDKGVIAFTHIPAGQYTLRLWHEVFGSKLWPSLVTLTQSQKIAIKWTENELIPISNLN